VPPVRQILLALLLAASGYLAWWLQGEEADPGTTETRDDHRPDYTAEQIAITAMGVTGRPDRRLVARKARHYEQAGETELDDPKLTLFREDEPPWLVRSERGRISEDGKEIFLQGPVFIDRSAGGEDRAVHIKTSELLVKPDVDYAYTERPVHATSGGEWLSSTAGAELWFGDQLHLKLFGRARLQIDAE
jgi:lipopolysaccharide export system protein LptC